MGITLENSNMEFINKEIFIVIMHPSCGGFSIQAKQNHVIFVYSKLFCSLL